MEAERTVNLALQGGGSHGAFTWGVLDRLLEEPGLTVEGISGTSAGAINAAVLAAGYQRGGVSGAREALARFWDTIGRLGSLAPHGTWWGWGMPGLSEPPWLVWAKWLGHWFSPYELNPLDINPLRDVLAETIDFDALRSCRRIRLFVSATNVRTNRLHVFTADQLSLDALLASACLPQLYPAVEIDGECYWDGGYMGNPVLEPLVSRCAARDILIVQVNPKYRDRTPRTAREISDRVNEITFNATLMREIRGIAGVTRMLDELGVTGHHYERAYFHMIDAEDVLHDLGTLSKLDTSRVFLRRLFGKGQERADAWLAEHGAHIGEGGTLDLDGWAPPEG